MSDDTSTPGSDDALPKDADRHPNNRFGVDFRAAATTLGPPPCPVIDFHAHIGGNEAAHLYLEAADAYGVERVFSMTRLEEVPTTEAPSCPFPSFSRPRFRSTCVSFCSCSYMPSAQGAPTFQGKGSTRM